MNKELYVYTTPIYKTKGLLKVGQCDRGRHAQRISEQFNASNPEPPEVLWVQDLPPNLSDHDIHNQLKKNGCLQPPSSPGREWFRASLDDVKKAYNQLVYDCPRTDNFKLRREQQQAVDTAHRWFSKKYDYNTVHSAMYQNRFLINAKMRFGKCFTGLHIAKKLQAQRIVIVTYKPQVIGEWIHAAQNHVDFKGWQAWRARKNDQAPHDKYLETGGEIFQIPTPFVLCVSMQDLEANTSIKQRLRYVLDPQKVQWDVLIFDEVHYGGNTDRTKKIEALLKPERRIDMSGTPFRLMGQVDFLPQQIFTYSYLDEQTNKQREITDDPHNKKPKIYRRMPDVNMHVIEVVERDLGCSTQSFYSPSEGDVFSLNQLFKVKNNKFTHPEAVDHFLSSLASTHPHQATSLSLYGTLGNKINLPPKKHSVWWLNRVASVQQLIKALKRHPDFQNYELINAAGCNDDEELSDTVFAKSKECIQNTIARIENKELNKSGSITLTCKKFLTGVTIEPWNMILVLNDVSSAEAYFQAIFRSQSAYTKGDKILKPTCYVFDFSPYRALKTVYEYADALAEEKERDPVRIKDEDLIKHIADDLCSKMRIKKFCDGNLTGKPVDFNELSAAVSSREGTVSLAQRITSDALIKAPSMLSVLEQHPYLYEVLRNIRGYKIISTPSKAECIEIGKQSRKPKANEEFDLDESELAQLNQSEVNKEKNKKLKAKKSWYAMQIKRLSIGLSDFIYMTKKRELKIDHVIQSTQPELFKSITGISIDDFNQLCEFELVRKDPLNRIVRDFRHQEESSVEPEKYVGKFLRSSSS